MPIVTATPISLKCTVCGGDIVNNYLGGTCVCANCGNKWAIADIIPNYGKYDRIIGSIAKANDILTNEAKVASANEAKLLFKQAVMECSKLNDPVAADLERICAEGQKQADKLAVYYKGKTFFEKRSYSSALRELSGVKGYRDADDMIERCKIEMEAERRRGIPWAVIFSLFIPASISIALREFAGWPVAVCILLFLAGSAGLGYILYRGGVWSIILKILSFLVATPLILFCVLVYVFHLGTGWSLLIAVGAPVVLFIIFANMTEQFSALTNKKN